MELEEICHFLLDDDLDGQCLDAYKEASLPLGADANEALHCIVPQVEPTTDVPLVDEATSVGLENTNDITYLNGTPLGDCSLTEMLLMGAEAIEAKNWQLASSVIDHLLVRSDQECGSGSFQRLSLFFTQGLHCKILTVRPIEFESLHPPVPKEMEVEAIAAFRMIQELSPYLKFAHFTANQAILEATVTDPDVHIIDFDVMEGFQWPPLMVDLLMREDASLRITAISTNERDVGLVQQTRRRLEDFAASVGLPFRFDQVTIKEGEDFQIERIEVGHSLIVNCVAQQVHTANRSFQSVESFLDGVRKLSPKMVVLVEEELFDFVKMPSMSFFDFFCEALHYYSALSDSLMSSFFWSRHKLGRRSIEEFLGSRILDSLKKFPLGGEGREGYGDGFSLLKGFKAIPVSARNVSQARMLAGLYGGAYSVELEKCRLALCWKSKPLTTASIWVPTCSSLEALFLKETQGAP